MPTFKDLPFSISAVLRKTGVIGWKKVLYAAPSVGQAPPLGRRDDFHLPSLVTLAAQGPIPNTGPPAGLKLQALRARRSDYAGGQVAVAGDAYGTGGVACSQLRVFTWMLLLRLGWPAALCRPIGIGIVYGHVVVSQR